MLVCDNETALTQDIRPRAERQCIFANRHNRLLERISGEIGSRRLFRRDQGKRGAYFPVSLHPYIVSSHGELLRGRMREMTGIQRSEERARHPQRDKSSYAQQCDRPCWGIHTRSVSKLRLSLPDIYDFEHTDVNIDTTSVAA